MGGAITWRGVVVCECMPAMLDSIAQATGPYLRPTQGSYSTAVSASARTHAGGGVIDISCRDSAGNLWSGDEIWSVLHAARSRGLDLSHRTPAQGFVHHLHGVMDACPHLSGIDNPVLGTAAWQIREYHAGRNGLAGRGADDGPRDYVGTTWWDYSASPANQASHPGDDDMKVITAPNRKSVLIGPGYVFEIDTDEMLEQLGNLHGRVDGNERQYDIWRAGAEQGHLCVPAPVASPTPAVDVNALAAALLRKVVAG